ncbi:maleylpyruvate isomerase family mycothiol-dependent enzyme [Streptomyces hyaluromycini]|uniref:maleylpyruvate isomerase family mycothiol-dependent enzyme n=1 Tax=Streptomyces hyaluromycini TaxID=1377993 RepID=UPI000B5CE2D0|nr:maleylpyruvate isomerase family mycothiol-dependent enzyme [Streptomyces hyaluromycini]
MKTADFLEILDREGRLLAAAALEAGLDAPVPTCPDWQVRDLLRHTGTVHRWAAGVVADAETSPRAFPDPPDIDDTELVTWYREGHRLLVDTLDGAPQDMTCWTFHPAPVSSPLAFWLRRQAHETTVHRYDAETARGGPVSPVGTGFAVDGIDELLRGFHARARSRVRSEHPRVLRVRTVDADGVWTVRLSARPPVTELGTPHAGTPHAGAPDGATAELSGPADQLYLALWNRVPVPTVTGDPELAELWLTNSGI